MANCVSGEENLVDEYQAPPLCRQPSHLCLHLEVLGGLPGESPATVFLEPPNLPEFDSDLLVVIRELLLTNWWEVEL